MGTVAKLIVFVMVFCLLSGCTQPLILKCDTCDYFTCLVNGKRFQPAGGWKATNLSAYTYQDKRIDISANGDDKVFIGISLNLTDTLRVGDYVLNNYKPGVGLCNKNDVETKTSAAYQGKLTISKIVFNDISVVEGSFNFVSIDSLTGQQIKLSDGIFRIQFGRYK